MNRRVVVFIVVALCAGSLAGVVDRAWANPTPSLVVEPSVGAPDGSVTVIGAGFVAGQHIMVANQTSAATVCSATVASDGTLACFGDAHGQLGSTSTLGASTATATYRSIGGAEITTMAAGGFGDGGPALDSGTAQPSEVANDAAGNVYICDAANDLVRRVDAVTHVITTIAGTGTSGFGGDGGPGRSAQLSSPGGVAVDPAGDVFISDTANARVREVAASTGVITTVAGTGTSGFGGDGGPAMAAAVSNPQGLAFDATGNLLIADSGNSRVRVIDAGTHDIRTVAGNASDVYGGDGGPATAAGLVDPTGVAVTAAGDLFIADYYGQRIRKVDGITQTITTFAGNGVAGFAGDGRAATAAELWDPASVGLDAAGNLYIADSLNQRIRKVAVATGVITTFAGGGNGGDGGPATDAALADLSGVSVDLSNNVFTAEFDFDQSPLNRVRRIDGASGIISTLAGNDSPHMGGDGYAATGARLAFATGLAVGPGSTLYVADYIGRVRRVDRVTGEITTVAGGGTSAPGDGGPAAGAVLMCPMGVAVDSSANLYIADLCDNRVREVDAVTGTITTIAGDGNPGFSGDNGPATGAHLDQPSGVAVDSAGDVLISDEGNGRVREVHAGTHVITTFAGNGSLDVTGDGGPAASAGIGSPTDVAIDAAGRVFIGAGVVRAVEPGTGIISSFAGGGSHGLGDGGPATQAELNAPAAIAVDAHGNLLISEGLNHRIRRVNAATGIISTIAGNGHQGEAGDGGPSTAASLDQPVAVAVDGSGSVFFGEFWGRRVREVPGAPTMGIMSRAISGGVSEAGASLGPLTATAQDQFGDPVAAPPGGLNVSLSSTSPGGRFAATPGGPAAVTVTIPAGQSSVSFYYGDSQVGTPTITASAPGHPGFGQQATLAPAAPLAPAAVAATRGDGSATVTWAPPPWDGGSPVTAYTVTSSPGGVTCVWSSGPLSCTVTGLTNGTPYTFTVTATNAAGSGPASAPSVPVTPAAVPSAPTGVTATAGNAQALVSWSPPASTGGAPIVSYLVTSGPDGKTCSWTAGPLICTVTGLTNGTSYTFDVVAHNAVGDGPASTLSNPVTPTLPTLFHALAPVRVLDSRPGLGNVGGYTTPWGTGTRRDITVGGLAGVPASADAVVLNVTVTGTTGSSFLTVWPAGQSQPTASSLNWTPGRTIPNSVTVRLGAGGKISIFNLSGSADVIADVAGYYDQVPGDGFTSVTPVRILDSRPGLANVGGYTTPWGTGTRRDVNVGGVDGVPADADAVVLNVTVTDTTGSSFLTVWPAGQSQPTASSLNWTPGVTIPNAVTVKLGTSGLNAGTISMFNLSGNVDVIADVAGYYEPGTGKAFHALNPARVLDSRPGAGNIGGYATPWGTGTNRDVHVGGVDGVPISADAVVLNVTVTNTTGSSFLTIWPTGLVQPMASSLNWTPGVTIPNAVTVKLGGGGTNTGRISMFNLSGSADVVTDVAGWFG